MNENRNINKELIDLILERLPENTSLVNVICDILNIHQEAAYRRIRGKVKFNFEEVVKIQEVLNLPLERIFRGVNKNNTGLKVNLITDNPLHKNDYCEALCKVMEDKISSLCHSYRALNVIPYNFLFKHELLSLMHYYKWLSRKHSPFEFQYSLSKDTPTHIRERQLKLKDHFESIDTTYIFSDNMLESYCREISYYKFLGYITPEEFEQIKEELRLVVEEISDLCVNEQFGTGKSVEIYISIVDIHASVSYLKGNPKEGEIIDASIHFLDGITSHIVSQNNNIATLTKDYFDHLTIHSTLITQSGTKYRLPYLLKQRELIEAME